MCEAEEDADVVRAWAATEASDAAVACLELRVLPTPRTSDGRLAVIPYSHATNYALGHTSASYIAYLTNDSLPHPDKYRAMAAALDANPTWGAVYCGQSRNGSPVDITGPIHDAACVLDHTQVMHRASDARWPLDMAKIRVGDAWFWRELHARFGPIQPVGAGVLDETWTLPDGISANY